MDDNIHKVVETLSPLSRLTSNASLKHKFSNLLSITVTLKLHFWSETFPFDDIKLERLKTVSELFWSAFHHYFLVWSKHIPHRTSLWMRFSERYIWGCSVAQLLRYRKGLKMAPFYWILLSSPISAVERQITNIRVAFWLSIMEKHFMFKNFCHNLFTFGCTTFDYICKQGV